MELKFFKSHAYCSLWESLSDFSVLVFDRKIYIIEIFRWWTMKEKLHEFIRRFSYSWLIMIENKLPKLRIAKLLSWREVPFILLLRYSANILKKMCQIWNHHPRLFNLNLSRNWKRWSYFLFGTFSWEWYQNENTFSINRL